MCYDVVNRILESLSQGVNIVVVRLSIVEERKVLGLSKARVKMDFVACKAMTISPNFPPDKTPHKASDYYPSSLEFNKEQRRSTFLNSLNSYSFNRTPEVFQEFSFP